MADIDMIPRSYRDGVRLRRMLAGYGAALALLVLAGGAASAALRWRLALESAPLDALRAGTAQAEAIRAQVAAAQARKAALQGATVALAALRGSGAVTALAGSLDGALNDKVWFEQMQFSRTQELLRDPVPAALPAGTLQAYSAAAGGAPGTLQTWRIASHLEIGGQALDHGALSAFLAAMAINPALSDVRFLNSSSAPSDTGAALTFSMAGALRQPGDKQ